MARKQSRGKGRAAAGVQAGKRAVKKDGSKLKDLDAKGGRNVRGGATPKGSFEVNDWGFDVQNTPTTSSTTK